MTIVDMEWLQDNEDYFKHLFLCKILSYPTLKKNNFSVTVIKSFASYGQNLNVKVMVEILIPLAFFASMFGIVYVIIAARNKERLALIEKGMDATIFRSAKKPINGKYVALMFGILFIGLSMGLVAGAIMYRMNLLPGPVPYFAMILLFGGISLLVYYMIIDKKKEEV